MSPAAGRPASEKGAAGAPDPVKVSGCAPAFVKTTWPTAGLSYPTRILGDERSALVRITRLLLNQLLGTFTKNRLLRRN